MEELCQTEREPTTRRSAILAGQFGTTNEQGERHVQGDGKFMTTSTSGSSSQGGNNTKREPHPRDSLNNNPPATKLGNGADTVELSPHRCRLKRCSGKPSGHPVNTKISFETFTIRVCRPARGRSSLCVGSKPDYQGRSGRSDLFSLKSILSYRLACNQQPDAVYRRNLTCARTHKTKIRAD